MKIPKTLSRPNVIFGLPQFDFYLVLATFMIGMILVNLLLSFGLKLKFWGYLMVPLLTWTLYIYLRWGARQNHPGFLLSLFSFHFLQPAKVLPTHVWLSE